LARLAWPPAAKWTGRCEGTFSYDERSRALAHDRPCRAALRLHVDADVRLARQLRRIFFPLERDVLRLGAQPRETQIEAKGATENSALARLSVDVKNGEVVPGGIGMAPRREMDGALGCRRSPRHAPPMRWRGHLRASELAVSTSAPKLDLLETNGDYLSSVERHRQRRRAKLDDGDPMKGSAIGDSLELEVTSPRTDLETLLAFRPLRRVPP